MSNKSILTITKRSDFSYIKKHGKKIRSPLLNVVYAKLLSEKDGTKVAYIASKKTVGNAVKRNRAKRRLRSLVREYYNIIPKNCLLLFISSSRTYNVEFKALRKDFLYCINAIVEKIQ